MAEEDNSKLPGSGEDHSSSSSSSPSSGSPLPDKQPSSRGAKESEGTSDGADSGSDGGKGKGIGGVSAGGAASAAGKKLAGKSETAQKAIETAEKTKRTALLTKTVAVKVAGAFKTFVATLMPPYGPVLWGLLIIFIIIGYLGYGVFLSTGRNDNRALCLDGESMNNQIGSISTDATEREIAQEVGAFLTNNDFEAFGGPLSVDQAAGLVGNMIHESAGLRPYVREGNAGDNSLLSNSEVRSWRVSQSGSTEGSNAAIGMIQWDGPRAEALISFAEERNTQWYEFDLQMEYLAHEMNTGYEAQQISGNSSLTSSGGNVDNYTVGFQDTFFRPAAQHAHTDRRLGAAIEFLEYFQEGEYSGSHGHIICNDTSNLAVGEIAETAMQMAWEPADVNNAKAGCSFNTNGGRACGRGEAKPEYIEGKELAHSETGMDPLANGDLFASCDRFVATVLRVTGVDEDVPWGSAETQRQHYSSSSNWSQKDSGTVGSINWGEVRPGDVLAASGHVAIYIGKVDGQDMVAHASIQANYQNGGNGMTGYQGPLSSLGSMSYEVYRAS